MPPAKKPRRVLLPPLIDASMWGISDMEMLGIVDDLADENGWTNTYAVRIQIGEDIEDVGRRSSVPQRLSWMRRYGWLEQNGYNRYEWRLTAIGHALLDGGELSRTFQTSFEKLNTAQRLRLTRDLAEGGANAAEEIRNAVKREFKRNLQRPKGR